MADSLSGQTRTFIVDVAQGGGALFANCTIPLGYSRTSIQLCFVPRLRVRNNARDIFSISIDLH